MNDFSAAGHKHGSSDFVVGIDSEVEFVISQVPNERNEIVGEHLAG